MTPEEHQRIEAIRDFLPLDDSWANAQLVWLLDLVERQEAEIVRWQDIAAATFEVAAEHAERRIPPPPRTIEKGL